VALREAELLDAIYAAPDDDAPRSVYADWLLERGDPRGELIALQLERARTGDLEVSLRERALLKTYQRDWLAWVWEALFPPSVRLERGFLHAASVDVRGVERLAARLTGDRRWRTVRSLAVLDAHPHLPLFLDPVLHELDELRQVPRHLLAALVEDPHPRPLRVLGLASMLDPRDIAALRAATNLSALRQLELSAYDVPMPEQLEWLWTAPLGARLDTVVLRLYQDAPSSAALAAWRSAAFPATLTTVHLRARERSFTLRRGPQGALDQVSIEDHRSD